MSSLSIDISVSYVSGTSLDGSPEAYLERILGRLHPDFVGDDVDPYSRRAALFRCRLCESRHSSFSQLRTHLKRCDGTLMYDTVAPLIEQTSTNCSTIREKSAAPGHVLTSSKVKPPASSAQIYTNEVENLAKNGLCLFDEPHLEPELEPICDTNNNEPYLHHVEEIKANVSNAPNLDFPDTRSGKQQENIVVVSNKKRVKPPPKKTKGKKAKVSTSKTILKPASQAVDFSVAEKHEAIEIDNHTMDSAVDKLDKKLENGIGEKKVDKFEASDPQINELKNGQTEHKIAGAKVETESVCRPKRSSKNAVSYEEQVIDFVQDTSPNSSPVLAKPKKISPAIELKRSPTAMLILTPQKINLNVKLEVAAKVDDATIKPEVKLKREFSVSRLESDFDQDTTNRIACKHCTEKIARREMIIHLRNKHASLPYLCQACFRAFETLEEQKAHKGRCKNKSAFKRLQQCRSRSTSVRRSEVGAPLTCDKCDDFQAANTNIARCALIRHIKNTHKAKFVCRFCFYNTCNVQLGYLHNCKGPSSVLTSAEDESNVEGAIPDGSSDEPSVESNIGAEQMRASQELPNLKNLEASGVPLLPNVPNAEVVRDDGYQKSDSEVAEIEEGTDRTSYQDRGASGRTPLKEIQPCAVEDHSKQDSFAEETISDGSEEFDVRKLKSYKNVADFYQFLTGDGKKLQCPLCMKEMNSKQWHNYKMHLISHASKQPFKVQTPKQSPIADQGLAVQEVETTKEPTAAEVGCSDTNQKAEPNQELTNLPDPTANNAVNQTMVLITSSAKLPFDDENDAVPVNNSPSRSIYRRKTRSSGKAEVLEMGSCEKLDGDLEPLKSSPTQFSFASPEKTLNSSGNREIEGPLSPSRGMKIDANGEIVVESVAMSPRKLSSDVESVNNERVKFDVKPKSKGAKIAKTLLPLHVDTKLKPAKESAKSGPPLNKEVKALLEQQAASEAFDWSTSNSTRGGRRSNPVSQLSKSSTDIPPNETKPLRSNPKRHSSVMSASEDPYRKDINQEQLGNKFPCPIKGCGSVLTGAEMMPHLINKHNQQSACHSCFHCFTSNVQLERHLQDVHQEVIKKPKIAIGTKQKGTNSKRQ